MFYVHFLQIFINVIFSWYLDIRNMLAILHSNANVDAENSGERTIIRRSLRVSRAGNLPSQRIHKTIVTACQRELLQVIKIGSIRVPVENIIEEEFEEDDEIEEIEDDFLNNFENIRL